DSGRVKLSMVVQTATSSARGVHLEPDRRPSWRRGVPRAIAAALVLMLVVTGCTNRGEKGRAPPGDWQVVWSDTFDGAANSPLSRKTWRHNIGTGYPGGAQNWGTAEIEKMTDSTRN